MSADATRQPLHYLPGRFLGALPPLKLSEYKDLIPLQGDAQTFRQCLMDLLPHLGDELVAVERRRLDDGGHCRLAVFRVDPPSPAGESGRGTEPVECFIAITGQGRVFTGSAETLEHDAGYQLDAFNPVEHEVLSIAITRRHRLVGHRLDLYIVTRGTEHAPDAPPRSEVYHGLIHLAPGGRPVLELPADDLGGQRPRHWYPLEGSRLPTWLRRWRSGQSVGMDPFDPDLDELDAMWPAHDGEADFVTLAKPWVGIGRAGELVLRRFGEDTDRYSLPVGMEVGFLSLTEASAEGEVIRGVTRAESRHLLGVEVAPGDGTGSDAEHAGHLRVAWRQLEPSVPVDAVMLARHDPEDDWPDLLVISRDGTLERLRYVGRLALRIVWKALWSRLDLAHGDHCLELLGQSRDEPLAWRRALLFGAVEGILERLPAADATQRRRWLDALADLFVDTEDYPLLTIGLHPILQCLRKAATLVEFGDRSPAMMEATVEILHRIYRQQRFANVELIDRIDDIVRSVEWFGEADALSVETRTRWAELQAWSQVHLHSVAANLDGDRSATEIIRRAGAHIEMWASALWKVDTVWLGRPRPSTSERPNPLLQLTGIAPFVTRGGTPPNDKGSVDGAGWLAVASRGRLDIHRVDPEGRLTLEPTASYPAPGNLRVVRLPKPPGAPDPDDRLWMIDGRGDIHLLALDAARATCRRLAGLDAGEWGGAPGTPGPLKALEVDDGGPWVAFTRSRGDSSILGLSRIHDGTLEHVDARTLDLPQISCLDLAVDDDGTLLLVVGSALGGLVELLALGSDGRLERRETFRPSGGASLATCFETPKAPKRCFIGDSSGFLWCARLGGATQAGRLEWLFRLDAAIHSIIALDFEGRRHLLLGGESGKLALIQSDNARRVWTETMLAPPRQLAVGSTPDGPVVVAMQGGWLCTFRLTRDRHRLLADVRRDLDTLKVLGARPQDSLWQAPDAATVAAFYDIVHRADAPERSLAQILEPVRGRERRARVLRFLAEEVWAQESRECREILPHLTFRDLYRLLAYLPQGLTTCEADILHQLTRRHPSSEPDSDDSPEMVAGARVQALQRLEQRQPSLDDVAKASHHGTENRLNDRWVRLELARVLMHTLARPTTERPPEGRSQRLLPRALPYLLDLPEQMLEACAQVLEDDSRDALDFRAFHRLVQDLSKTSSGTRRDLRRTRDCFRGALADTPKPDPVVPYVAALADLLWDFSDLEAERRLGEESLEDLWTDERVDILDGVRRLTAQCYTFEGRRRSETRFVALLRTLLPRTSVPEDTERLEHRTQWMRDFHQRLLVYPRRSPEGDDLPWERPMVHCAHALRGVLRRIAEWESQHIHGEVRPFVEIHGNIHIDVNRRVFLPLRLVPEGHHVLDDVSIRVDAGGDGGLLPPPEDLSEIVHLGELGERSPSTELELSGYAPAGHDTVTVIVTLESGNGYRHRQPWIFPLPVRRRSESSGLASPFQRAMEQTLQRLLEHVDSESPRVLVAPVDRILGRRQLIEGWSRQTHGRLLDLDAELRPFGQGRTYSERPLDLELLTEILTPDAEDIHRPTLVTATEETLQRLLDGEAPGLLQRWVDGLQKGYTGAGPSLILLVSSTHACALRQCGLPIAADLCAHQAVQETRTGHHLPSSDAMEDLTRTVQAVTQLDLAQAQRRIARLGGDLFLVAHWLRWVEAKPGRGLRPLDEVLESRSVKARLEAELSGLGAFDLLIALVGAVAETTVPLGRVRPGLVSARNYRSTTVVQQSKLLQERGQVFTQRTLHQLHSDRRPPEQVRLEGFGTLGTASAQGTHLLNLTQSRGAGERQRSFERLAALGLGTWAGGLYRTAEPYRGFVRALYDSVDGIPLEKRDGEIYRRLFGRRRSPLESLSLGELSKLPHPQLRRFLPKADDKDLDILPDLVRLWDSENLTDQQLLSTLGRLFRRRHVVEVMHRGVSTEEPTDGPKQRGRRDGDRWDGALAALPYPKYGVGRLFVDENTQDAYPIGYHLWIERGVKPDLARIDAAITHTVQRRQEVERHRGENILSWTPRVVLVGPGVEDLPDFDPQRRVAFLRERDICQALWEGSLEEELLRTARAQLRLTAISPFQTSGPIPPGSRFFFGRQEEMSFIESNLRRSSILIVGSRRVGKTSLLNQVRYWARQEPDLEPIYVDLQRVTTEKQFHRALNASLADFESSEELKRLAGSMTLLKLTDAIRAEGRLPIFLFNEIDGLAHLEPLVGAWRAANERNQARFVLVAYSTVAELGKVESPFYHFTVGTSYGGRAIAPAALSSAAARQLLGVLTDEELGLRWSSETEENTGIRWLLERSYRIPWVLQYFGHLLLKRLEDERRGIITLADVEVALAQEGEVVWRYIDSLDYASLGSRSNEASRRPGYQLVLFCLAREKYFLGEKPLITEERLRDRPALDPRLSFTVAEARDVVKAMVSEVLDDAERDRLHAYYDDLELETALRLLTLTLALEADPKRSDRYGFLMHILPLELHRQYGAQDPTLDGLILETAVELMGHLHG